MPTVLTQTYNPIPEMTDAQQERFWSKVDVVPGICWEWTAATSKTGGYGIVHLYPKVFKAHRVAYALLMGQPPVDLALDHLCRNRLCVNPDHLEPVTIAQNAERGHYLGTLGKRKTHCKHGHELSGDNVRMKLKRGRETRLCLTCYRAEYQERTAARSALRAARRSQVSA